MPREPAPAQQGMPNSVDYAVIENSSDLIDVPQPVSGTATVTAGDKMFYVRLNESIYIPMGEVHRLQGCYIFLMSFQ